MKKIVHASEAISLSALSEKFREEGYEVVSDSKSNVSKLTKDGQSVTVRAFKGDRVFELYADSDEHADSDERCVLLSTLQYIALELFGYILVGVMFLIFQSWIAIVISLILFLGVLHFSNYSSEREWESKYSKHKAIVDLVSQTIK